MTCSICGATGLAHITDCLNFLCRYCDVGEFTVCRLCKDHKREAIMDIHREEYHYSIEVV